MKKKNAKKSGAKKDEKPESTADEPNAEGKSEAEPASMDANGENTKTTEDEPAQDAEETISELPSSSHNRSPSLSQQSRMRSSSFRQSSGGLPSPSFPPAGDTAPEIYRKQAMKIEELERENKRLAKEASEGEKRWKKAEEELEDLREAEVASPKGKDGPAASSGEIEKLVCYIEISLAYVANITI